MRTTRRFRRVDAILRPSWSRLSRTESSGARNRCSAGYRAMLPTADSSPARSYTSLHIVLTCSTLSEESESRHRAVFGLNARWTLSGHSKSTLIEPSCRRLAPCDCHAPKRRIVAGELSRRVLGVAAALAEERRHNCASETRRPPIGPTCAAKSASKLPVPPYCARSIAAQLLRVPVRSAP